MKNYKRALDIIINDSIESDIPIIELLNDMPYIMELANTLQLSFDYTILLTNYIELKGEF